MKHIKTYLLDGVLTMFSMAFIILVIPVVIFAVTKVAVWYWNWSMYLGSLLVT